MVVVPHRMLQEMGHALQAVNAKAKEEVLVAIVLQGNFVLTFTIFPLLSHFFNFFNFFHFSNFFNFFHLSPFCHLSHS
jgi:hypothetical protein